MSEIMETGKVTRDNVEKQRKVRGEPSRVGPVQTGTLCRQSCVSDGGILRGFVLM